MTIRQSLDRLIFMIRRPSLYSQVLLIHGPIYCHFPCSPVLIAAEHESDLKLTTDTPYLARGVCCEEIGANWRNYDTALYWDGPGFLKKKLLCCYRAKLIYINSASLFTSGAVVDNKQYSVGKLLLPWSKYTGNWFDCHLLPSIWFMKK